MHLNRRTAISWICATTVSAHAANRTWPERTITMIVPGAPGSTPDRLTRLIAERLSRSLGATIVVDNKPGAATRVGAEYVSRAPADGYTLLATYTTHTMARVLYPETKFDPIADFQPVTTFATPEITFVVAGDSPHASLAELLAAARSNKSPLRFANFGTGSSWHYFGLEMGKISGTPVVSVPYKGESAQLADVVGGHIESSFCSVGTALPLIRSGKLKALGVVSTTRSKQLPEVPTFSEQGFPGISSPGWIGLLAPAKTPADVVALLSTHIATILADPVIVAELRPQGLEPLALSRSDFKAQMVDDVARWHRLSKEFPN